MEQKKSVKQVKKRRKKKKKEFGKIALLLIIFNCAIVEVYSMVAMWHFGDLTALYSLIGAVVGASIAYIAYCGKSAKENTRGGITYELAMQDQPEDPTAVG